MCVAVSLPELWRSRRALGVVQGIDLTPANQALGVVGDEHAEIQDPSPLAHMNSKLRAAPSRGVVVGEGAAPSGNSSGGGSSSLLGRVPALPCSVWQCGGGYQELSQRLELLSLDCSGPVVHAAGGGLLDAVRGGTCHALLLWLDYDLDAAGRWKVQNGPDVWGGPSASTHEVLLLNQPQEIMPQLQPEGHFPSSAASISVVSEGSSASTSAVSEGSSASAVSEGSSVSTSAVSEGSSASTSAVSEGSSASASAVPEVGSGAGAADGVVGPPPCPPVPSRLRVQATFDPEDGEVAVSLVEDGVCVR